MKLSDKSVVGQEIEISQLRCKAGEKMYRQEEPVTQMVGSLIAKGNEAVRQLRGPARNCAHFRIPAAIQTSKGTLLAAFDARYLREGDLCSDIDVAIVRSIDGGRSWTRPAVAMDAGAGDANGCGDPCMVEDADGRIWIQALTTHFKGGTALKVSKTGHNPKNTGQWNMTSSSNEGKSWSKKLINPTKTIKNPAWNLFLAGPGNGITLKDGTIVFPAQAWTNGSDPRSQSTICYSKDAGKTWKMGKGMPHATSESQVVELRNGSIMINCRNERRSGKRAVYVTKDMGETWVAHETNLNTLNEPTCQASLISIDSKKYGKLLLFSNPNNPKASARNTMAIKFSKNEGKTWSKGYIYDARETAGYSNLMLMDDETLGVVYESAIQSSARKDNFWGMNFLRIPLKTILKAK